MKCTRLWAFALVFALSWVGVAQAVDEGIDYRRLSPAQPTDVPAGHVEVIELFWYGCPHCDTLEPKLQRWKADLPEDVTFRAVPAVLNPNWVLHAQAYYTAEVLGVLDRIHQPMYDAIHRERRALNSREALRNFFAEHGVEPAQFDQTFNSFAVQTRVRRADALGRRYGATSVPSMVVNGKYYTDGAMAGGQDRMLEVVNALVEQERAQARAAQQ
ncbi:thiol:disulfide interchange protein DsbA/DsbL [Ectothiorhodospiraceae bacterium 2226]|nr:thiol:disulfide interchange protein DsbA/DsbL [Ectothiorhodospiraceae bacterium 2226]